MRADSQGIHIQKAELGALLAFCGDTSANNVVKFLVGNSGKMAAVASDGKRLVEVESSVDVDGAIPGEWAVDRNYLETMRRVLDEGETEGLLKVTEKGIRAFYVVGVEGGDVRRKFDAPTDVASTQLTFDAVRKAISKAVADKGSWFALQSAQLKGLNDVIRATKCPVSLQGGRDATAPVAFMATCEAARWSGTLMPTPVNGFGDEAVDKGDGADEDAPPGAADDDDFKLTPELATQKKKKPKATKATGRKPRAAKKAEITGETASGDDGVVPDDYEPDGVVKSAAKKGRKKS